MSKSKSEDKIISDSVEELFTKKSPKSGIKGEDSSINFFDGKKSSISEELKFDGKSDETR